MNFLAALRISKYQLLQAISKGLSFMLMSGLSEDIQHYTHHPLSTCKSPDQTVGHT